MSIVSHNNNNKPEKVITKTGVKNVDGTFLVKLLSLNIENNFKYTITSK